MILYAVLKLVGETPKEGRNLQVLGGLGLRIFLKFHGRLGAARKSVV